MPLCALCRHDNDPEYTPPVLPEAAGPPDFDTRPAEPERGTIGSWVSRCAACGYCNGDLTVAGERAASTVASEAYQALLGDESLPLKAREFLCWACVLEKEHEYADAGWSALHAAWVCDDAAATAAGARCRARAIELWRRGKAIGQLFCDDMGSEFALVTDLHRRMGEWEHARVTCAEGLDLEDLPLPVEAMLRRQMVLIQQHDSEAHSMRELLTSAQSRQQRSTVPDL
jgi:hypothetical protein